MSFISPRFVAVNKYCGHPNFPENCKNLVIISTLAHEKRRPAFQNGANKFFSSPHNLIYA